MSSDFATRIRVLHILFVGVFFLFVVRLFDLQVVNYDEYAAEAKAQHEKRSILPARRGKILVRKNRFTQEVTPLAANNTLKMLFVDPVVLRYPKYNPKLDLNEQEQGDSRLAAKLLAPILIHAHCEKVEGCEIETDVSKLPPVEQTAVVAYQQELEKTFGQLERTRMILETEVAESRAEQITALRLPGVWMEGDSVLVDPTRVGSVGDTAETLAPILNMEERRLKRLLGRRLKRYVKIMGKIVPEVSEMILKLKGDPKYRMMLRGIQLRDEHWRYYPEKTLASQVLGFVDSRGNGQYGMEGRFDHLLRGEEGWIFGATSVRGQRILGKKSGILRAQDGSDVLLSIDRVIQGEVEKILQDDLVSYDADFAQVIVVEPKSGRILAMANAPTFNPNEFGKAFLRYEITPEQETADREDELFNQRIPTVFENGKYFRYFNLWGAAVFRNKLVTDLYEPGSVMKAMTMSAALNADEITPYATYDDRGPVKVDEFTIRNSDNTYNGITTMGEVLDRSLNTGIAYITQKMGAELLYKYFRDFGFGQYTDIEFDGEEPGKMEHWNNWTASELVTRGFGQGISTTPLQMAMAFGALANGGYLMKPLLVEEIRQPDGNKKTFVPERVRRVLSGESVRQIQLMLQSAVARGTGRGARVWGHTLAGKTGTSQTYRNGKAQEGLGTTIASFAGFGPVEDPQFVILVKYDYPKYSRWGSETAAITFRRVAAFLFDYLEIPPDK